MIENKDYQFVNIPEQPDKCCVKLLSGQFKDVIHDYGTISVDEEDESCILTFDVTVQSAPDSFANAEEVENHKEFQTAASDILVNILKEENLKIQYNSQNEF